MNQPTRYQIHTDTRVPVYLYLDGVALVDARPEVVRVSSERDFQQRQEAVHPRQQTLRTAPPHTLITHTHTRYTHAV